MHPSSFQTFLAFEEQGRLSDLASGVRAMLTLGYAPRRTDTDLKEVSKYQVQEADVKGKVKKEPGADGSTRFTYYPEPLRWTDEQADIEADAIVFYHPTGGADGGALLVAFRVWEEPWKTWAVDLRFPRGILTREVF